MSRFLATPSGRAGLAILGAVFLLALLAPLLVPFPEAGSRWRDISYWEEGVAAAPPAWVNGPWNGFAYPPTRVLGPSSASTREGGGGTLFVWTFETGGLGAPVPGGGAATAPELHFRAGGEGRAFLLVAALPEGAGPGTGRELLRREFDLAPGGKARAVFARPPEARIEATLFLPPGGKLSCPPELVAPGLSSGLLGTDSSKRDVYTGLVLGIRWALVLGIAVSFLTVVTGLLLGTVAACFGGFWDGILNRVYEFFSMMPLIPFLVAVSAAWKPSLWTFMGLALLFYWTRAFKTVYARALQIKAEGHVEAAVMIGAGRWWRITRHVLPELLPYGFAVMAMSVPGVILAEAGVSLLGLGDSSTVTWGQMLHDAFVQGAVINRLWWWVLPPGLAMALMGLCFALLARGIEAAFDPARRRMAPKVAEVPAGD